MVIRKRDILARALGRSNPLGVFHEYPVLLRLGLISLCAETAWATLIAVMEYFFLNELLVGQAHQYIASRVSMAMLAFALCECVLKIPMGMLSDRIGPRPVVLFALSIACIPPLLMTFAKEWYLFLPLRAVDGIAAAALWPSMSALMARSVPREAKAAAMSVFNGAYCLGLAIGPMSGLYLGHLLESNRKVFPFCSVVMMIGLAIAFWVLRPASAKERAEGKVAFWSKKNGNGAEAASQSTPLLRGRPMLIRMMALYALSQTAVGVLISVLPIFLQTEFKIYQQDLPRMMVVPALFVAAIAIPVGRLADTIGKARSVWFSYIMATFGMLLVALSGRAQNYGFGMEVFGLGMLFLVLSYILGTPAWLGLTSLQVDDTRQAGALSLMQTSQGVGVVIGLGLVASAGHWMTQWKKVGAAITHKAIETVPLTKDVVPISVWLYVASVIFALCLIGTLLYVREPKHDPHADELAESSKQPLEMTGV